MRIKTLSSGVVEVFVSHCDLMDTYKVKGYVDSELVETIPIDGDEDLALKRADEMFERLKGEVQ